MGSGVPGFRGECAVAMADRSDIDARLKQALPIISEHADECDEQAQFPDKAMTALRESGLLGLLVPTVDGGLGGAMDDLAYVAAEIAPWCLSTATIWAMHCQQVVTLVKHATPTLRERVLPRLADGQLYLASVTSERVKGGHLLSCFSPLRCNDGALTLHRDAPIVTGGAYADAFLITMQASSAASPADVTLVYAERDQVRLDTRGDWNPMGMRATHSVAMSIDGDLPLDQVVGPDGGFRQLAIDTFIPAGHIGWAACWLGAARGAMRDIVELARTPAGRQQLNVRSEIFMHRLARIRLDLDVVSALLKSVIAEVGDRAGRDLADPDVQLHLNGLKIAASDRCFAAVDQMIELCGLRHGYFHRAPIRLERLFRDLRSASLNYSNDRLLAVNGRLTLLDRDVRLC